MSAEYDRFSYFRCSRQKLSICKTANKPPSVSLFSSPQTPVKVGKGKSQKENGSRCLCRGINLHGAGSSYNLYTRETLVHRITSPIQGILSPERQSSWVCKACFRRVASLGKRSAVLCSVLQEFRCKFERNNCDIPSHEDKIHESHVSRPWETISSQCLQTFVGEMQSKYFD